MQKPLKLTFIADTHHYSKTLGTSGRQYELRSGSDQKCLAESGAIIDAAFDHLARSDTRAVLLAGDLTNDGEMVCHRELREKLYALAEKKPVYLITNTHDWCCDGNPRRFTGARVTHDVPTMPHTGIHDFYYDFGGRQAIAEYRTHLGISSLWQRKFGCWRCVTTKTVAARPVIRNRIFSGLRNSCAAPRNKAVWCWVCSTICCCLTCIRCLPAAAA